MRSQKKWAAGFGGSPRALATAGANLMWRSQQNIEFKTKKYLKAPKLYRTHQLAQPRAEEAGQRGKQVRCYDTTSSKSVSSEDSQGDEPEESEWDEELAEGCPPRSPAGCRGMSPASSIKLWNCAGAVHAPQEENSAPCGLATKKVLGVRETIPNFHPHLVTPGFARMWRHLGFPFTGGLALATQPDPNFRASPPSTRCAAFSAGTSGKGGGGSAGSGGGGSKSAPGRQPAMTREEICAL